jgi:hypothetical protein
MDKRSMSDDSYEAALRYFIADLNRARLAAGMPSYGRLEQLSLRLLQDGRRGDVDLMVLSKSTTQEILTGQREGAPRWQWVLAYVTVLHIAARKASVTADSIGGIDEWKRKHEAVCAAELAGRPVPVMAASRVHVAGRDEDDLIGEFLRLIRRAGGRQWWHGYSDAVPEWLAFYLYLESIATRIRTYEPQAVPCLLQTEEYARAGVARSRPGASLAEVARGVELRMRRQALLREPAGCRLWAVARESTLRDQRAGRRVMRRQPRHLIDTADQPNVAISVLPPGTDDNATIREPVTVFRFAERHLGDVACLEQPGDGLFLYKQEDIVHYSQLMDILAIRATGRRRDVQDLLWRILRES